MGNAFWLSWEPGLILFLQKFVTPVIKTLSEIITFFGDEYAMILLLGFLYWGYKKELGKKIALSAISALICSITLNNLVMRRRPYFDHPAIKCLKPRSSEGDPYDLSVQGFSFPSGHATNSVSTYAALGLNIKNKPLKVVLFVLPVLIGLSRLILGVHYPTDILAGWALSALAILLVSSVKNTNILYLLLIAVGIGGCFVGKSNDYYSALGIAFGFIAGFIFEEKFVHFENSEKLLLMLLRTAGGLLVFVVLDKLLKLPFPESLLSSSTPLQFLIRTVRYTLVSFVMIGVYPLSFRFIEKKLFRKG